MRIKFKGFVYAILIVFSVACSAKRVATQNLKHETVVIPDSLYPSPSLIIETHNDWTRANFPKKIKEFRATPLQMHDIVFLGNSITQQGGDWSKRLAISGIKNRGIAGDNTDGVFSRLGEVTFVKPAAVFLEIGINDLYNPKLSPERTSSNIIKIVHAIHEKSPSTKIFVETIFPTSRDSMRVCIEETNKYLRKNYNSRMFTIIDTHKIFTDEHDLMRKEYTRDGLHLTELGYSVWVAYLKKYFN